MTARHCLKLVGLSLLVALAMIAVAVTSAQAADWLVEVKPGVHELIINTNALPIELEEDKKGVLVTKSGAAKVEILCTAETISKGLIEGEGKASGTVEYSGCITKLNGSTAGVCKPVQPIKVPFKAELFEHEGEAYVSVLPAKGSVFAVLIVGEAGESECAIGEKFDITGSVALKDCGLNGLLALELRHLIELDDEVSLVGRSTALLFGGNAADLTGSVWVKLTTDQRWKAMTVGVL